MFFVSFKGYGETRPPTIGARRRERTTTLPLPLGGGALPAASLPLPSTASIYDRSGHGAVVGSSARRLVARGFGSALGSTREGLFLRPHMICLSFV